MNLFNKISDHALNYLRLTLLGTAVAFLIVSPGALAGTSHGDNGSPSKFRSEAAIGEQFVPLSVVPNLSRAYPINNSQYTSPPVQTFAVITTIAAILAIIASLLILGSWLYATLAKITWPFLKKYPNNKIGPILNALGQDFFPKLDKRCAGHGNGLIYPQLFFDGSNGEASCAWDETVYFKEDADDWLRSQGY